MGKSETGVPIETELLQLAAQRCTDDWPI